MGRKASSATTLGNPEGQGDVGLMHEAALMWMSFGLCRGYDPEFFFPHDAHGTALAQRVCDECPVKEPCLAYALRNNLDHGVWGGTSERERKRLRGKRQAR